jgi:hypothetical protein
MTDRELLELAAKAAGIDWIKNCVWIENGFYSPLATHERISWNPLTEDRDALRLAVKLGLFVDCDEVLQEVEAVLAAHFQDDDYVRMSEKYGTDPYAATRRAIVRAAAEIERLK